MSEVVNKDDKNILNNDSNEMTQFGIDNSDNVSLEEITEKVKENEDMVVEDTENPPVIETEVDGRRRRKINNNTYVAKKTAAQGLLDIALLTANANQLRYIIEYSSSNVTSAINITLICISVVLQIAIGITLALQGRYYYRGESKKKSCKNLKNYIIIGVFLITIVNVFIASFTQIVPLDQIVSANSRINKNN